MLRPLQGEVTLSTWACFSVSLVVLATTANAQDWVVQSNVPGAGFGSCVANAGDVDRDGYEDVIVGARDWSGSTLNGGAAFLYRGRPSGLDTVAAWSFAPSNSGSYFGMSVAGAGDVNGDGYADVVIGAPRHDAGQTNEGRAWLFLGGPAGLSASPAWTAESNQSNAEFGTAVAGIGDVNGDGYDDVAVGAPRYDNGQTDEGRVYLYYGHASGLPANASGVREPNRANVLFGGALAGGVDVNRDGYDDLIVGAQYWDNGQVDEGAAFVYLGSASGVASSPAWQVESNLSNCGLGNSVAGLEDFNGDGYADVLVGSQRYDGTSTDQGRIQVFLGGPTGPATAAFLTLQSGQSGALLGSAVASAGYVNDDAFSDILVGARYFDSGQSNEGAVFVYLGAASAPSATPFAYFESNQADAELGISVAGIDARQDGAWDVILGAWRYDSGETDEGIVWGFHQPPGAPRTRYVSSAAPWPGLGTAAAPYSSIQFALAHPTTKDGDTLSVAPGIYLERLDFLGKDVHVIGSGGPAATTIDAQFNGSVVRFVQGEGPGATLEGFTLIHGTGSVALGTRVGGGVFCSASSPTLRNLRIQGCSATLGGGVGVDGGSPSVIDCSIRGNAALADTTLGIDGIGGGAYLLGTTGASRWSGGEIVDNRSDMDGPGLYAKDSQLEMSSVQVTDNVNTGPIHSLNPAYGGGLCIVGTGTAQIDGCVISRNTILGPYPTSGGGVAALAQVQLVGCTIEGNVAGDSASPGFGGGLYGSFAAEACQIISNYGEAEGGGAYGGTLQDCTVRSNRSSMGAGISQSQAVDCVLEFNLGAGTASVDFGAGAYQSNLLRCLIRANHIGGQGGGAFNSTLTDCHVTDNVAYAPGSGYSGSGGGIEGGTATGCRIEGNRAEADVTSGPMGLGGGANGALLVRCEIRANRVVGGASTGNGGGAANSTLVQCAVFDNDADIGGGVYNSQLDRCTVYANVSGIYSGGADSCGIASSILRANTPDQFNSSAVTYSNVQGGASGPGNIDANAMFLDAALRDFHLRGGSPCIDAGAPTAPLDPDGTRADMGAFPFDPNYCMVPVAYCTAKTNSQGCLPQIGWTGTASLGGADDLFVTATGVLNQKSGLVFWGTASSAQPFQGGFKCVASPSVRTPVVNSGGNPPPDDCSGVYSFHFSHSYMASNGLTVGQPVYAQWWTRDPASPQLTGLTNAVRWVICP